MAFPIRQDKFVPAPRRHRLSWWLLGIALLAAFAFLDIAAVALPAMAVSPGQVLAFGAAFVLITGGVLFTVWRLE